MIAPFFRPDEVKVSWEYYYDPVKQHALTSTDPNLNPWWSILTNSISKHFQITGNLNINY